MSRKQGPRIAGMRPTANAARLPTQGGREATIFVEAAS